MTGDGSPGVYLDASATAPLRPEAREAMLTVLDTGPGNASSVHSFGHRARTVVEEARAAIAEALGATPAEVIFTSGGTEANNLAVIGLTLAHPGLRRVVTTAIEHPSVTESCRFLQRVHGVDVVELPVDEFGLVDPVAVAEAVRLSPALVSIGLANGEVGTVQPIAEIANALRDGASSDGASSDGAFPRSASRGGAAPSGRASQGAATLLHTDAVQAAASLPVSFGAGGWPGGDVHAMSLAGHKFGGPQGVGALLLRGGLPIEPVLHGGGQENGRRSGTENVAAIAGFAAAVTAAARDVGTRALALSGSRDELVERLLAAVPGARLTGHPTERLPGHASFVVPGVSGESLLVALDAAGFAASSGSACAAGKDEPSPVLIALGTPAAVAQTALRITLHEPLEHGTIDRIVAVLSAEVRRARRE